MQSAERGFASRCRSKLLRSLDGSTRKGVAVVAGRCARPRVKMFALLIAILLLPLLSGHRAHAQGPSCDQEQSKQEIRRLTDGGTVISVDVFLPNVTVVVDDRAWQRAPLDRKKAIAHDVECATNGPNSTMIGSVYFRSGKTNKELATYSGDALTVE